MKNILIILLLLLSVQSFSQEDKITGVFTTSRQNTSPRNEYSTWGESTDINLEFTINFTRSVLSINNKQLSVYSIKEKISSEKIPDSDGDQTTSILYNAVDEENIKCQIKIRYWDDYNIIQVYVYYNDIYLLFEGKFNISKKTQI